MIESTARAERLDLPSSVPPCYTWEVPQKPVAVRLPFPFIERLEHETVEAFRSLTSRGSEIGGVLLGRIAAGNPSLITIEDYEAIPCDYSRGPLYRLAEADLRRIEQAIERHSSGPGLRVVGYFRSHTRKGLALDAEDVALFEARFHDPLNIVLLIRPFATKISTAGIFVRENGRLAGDASSLEFPFRASELPGRVVNGNTEPAPPPAAAIPEEPPAPPSKPQGRAQIVPIASRRDFALPEPPPLAPPPLPVVEAVESKPPAAPPAQPEVRTPVPEPKSSPEPKPAETIPAPRFAAAAPPEEKAAEPAEIPFTFGMSGREEAAESAPSSKKLRLLVATALAMIVLVGGGLFVAPSLFHHARPAPPPASQDSSPLSLRIERTSGGLLLTWNHDSEVIKNAVNVVLSITDGDRHENIEMDPNQVRTGSIVYPPMTQDVSFQMEVTDAHNTKTASESLRIRDPRPSPLAQPAAAPQTAAAGSAAPVKNAVTETAGNPSEGSMPAEAAPQAAAAVSRATPARPFDSTSLAQRLRSATPADLPDAPSIASPSASNLSGSVPGVGLVQSLSSAAPTASSLAPGGKLTPAEAIYKAAPDYPKIARQAGAKGIVELQAIVGADGRVKEAHAIKGHPMLLKPAVDAVKQWRYKPALLNGKPVESPIDITLNFVPQQ